MPVIEALLIQLFVCVCVCLFICLCSGIRDKHPGLKVGDVIFEVDGRYLLESSFQDVVEASQLQRDLGRAPYVLYGVKYIDLVSLDAEPWPANYNLI